MPKITVITPTFNAEKYLEQILDTVAEQNYPNLEYIIVDGGSTDKTMQIVRGARKGLITRWISEPDHGISDAFNKGIQMATGDIVGIINADDGYLPGALAAVAETAQNHPDSDVYYGNAIHERFDGTDVYEFRPKPQIGPDIWRSMPVSHPATFVRRLAYERFGLFDTRCPLAMDYELLLRFYCMGANFQHVNAFIARFRYGQARGLGVLKEVRDSRIRNGQAPFLANCSYLQSYTRALVKMIVPVFVQKMIKNWMQKPSIAA